MVLERAEVRAADELQRHETCDRSPIGIARREGPLVDPAERGCCERLDLREAALDLIGGSSAGVDGVEVADDRGPLR